MDQSEHRTRWPQGQRVANEGSVGNSLDPGPTAPTPNRTEVHSRCNSLDLRWPDIGGNALSHRCDDLALLRRVHTGRHEGRVAVGAVPQVRPAPSAQWVRRRCATPQRRRTDRDGKRITGGAMPQSRTTPVTQWACRRWGDAPAALLHRARRRARRRWGNAQGAAHTGCALAVSPVGRRPRGAFAPVVAEGASPVGQRPRGGAPLSHSGRVAGGATPPRRCRTGRGRGRVAGRATPRARRTPRTHSRAGRQCGGATATLSRRSSIRAGRQWGEAPGCRVTNAREPKARRASPASLPRPTFALPTNRHKWDPPRGTRPYAAGRAPPDLGAAHATWGSRPTAHSPGARPGRTPGAPAPASYPSPNPNSPPGRNPTSPTRPCGGRPVEVCPPGRYWPPPSSRTPTR